MTKQRVGIVKEINLYPVKSMRGVSIEKADLYWYGLNGDRKYAFIHDDAASGFPWLTARELPQLLQYQPNFVSPESLLNSKIKVETPTLEEVALESPELLQELSSNYDKKISLLKLKRGTFDCMPVSLISSSSLATFEKQFAAPLDVRRFRSNIVVETTGGDFPENNWLGQILVFGERSTSASVTVNYSTKRCIMINLQPETGEADTGVLKLVAEMTRGLAGVYSSPQTLGDIHVGDIVYLQAI
jgi:uncharacterized protein